MASWVIDGEVITAEHVEFGNILPGMEVLHLYVPDDDTGDIKMWGGVVKEFLSRTGEWYGSARWSVQANDYTYEPFTKPVVTVSPDGENSILVVAEWHGNVDGHSLYRVTGREQGISELL